LSRKTTRFFADDSPSAHPHLASLLQHRMQAYSDWLPHTAAILRENRVALDALRGFPHESAGFAALSRSRRGKKNEAEYKATSHPAVLGPATPRGWLPSVGLSSERAGANL